jgi:hypothetical protein
MMVLVLRRLEGSGLVEEHLTSLPMWSGERLARRTSAPFAIRRRSTPAPLVQLQSSLSAAGPAPF